MRVYFDETWADVSMSKTGAGTYTLTAQLCGLWHEFKTVTQDARLFDSFGDDDIDAVQYVTESVRNLITERLLAHQVEVGKMKGFLIGESLWLPIKPSKRVWESGMPMSGYFEWGDGEYWLVPYHYEVYTSEEDGTMTVESFDTIADANEFAATNPIYRVDRWVDLEIPFRF